MRTSGMRSFNFGLWRLQFYWPEVMIRSNEFRLSIDTNLRIFLSTQNNKYFGAGFNVFGFGIGFDHFTPTQPEMNKQTLERPR